MNVNAYRKAAHKGVRCPACNAKDWQDNDSHTDLTFLCVGCGEQFDVDVLFPSVDDYLAADPSDLGPDATPTHVKRYNQALRDAWNDDPPDCDESALELCDGVLIGRIGDGEWTKD